MSMSLVTIQEASRWATDYLERDISPTNISYLLQYGRVKKYGENGSTRINLDDLREYYTSQKGEKEVVWKKKLGDDLNWSLSFDHLREKDTTKHVHRLHPYKGKFIPQLVEYFIDAHTDEYKKEVYFKPGDIVLDPFSGSGTTLVQANETNIHSIGIDVSQFNCMMGKSKVCKYSFDSLDEDVERIKKDLESYEYNTDIHAFEKEIAKKLSEFNNVYFPSPDFKYKVSQGEIDENTYSERKEKEFLSVYNDLLKKYKINLKQDTTSGFLDIWYCDSVRKEIDFAFDLVNTIKDERNRQVLAIILSRTIRSCRATTHADLATLKYPQLTSYYCWKHKKICKPVYSIKGWFNRYANDTLARLREFDCIRNDTYSAILSADSRSVDIANELKKQNGELYTLFKKQKIRGIFTSPPYVGQIDYHEQHAYAYDLFGFERRDTSEIGPLFKGQGASARRSYVVGISEVLLNCRKYLTDDFDIFLVANDKHNLYPFIAAQAHMRIVNTFKRPVLNRTERDKSPYAEYIFHLKA